MLVQPDSIVRVAVNENTAFVLDSEIACDSVTLTPRFSEGQVVTVEGNTLTMPTLEVPEKVTCTWCKDGVTVATTYAEVVSRHYFKLDELRKYGDGQDDFAEMDEAVLFQARQAATEVFEKGAHRSFVHRVGRTKDFGRGTFLNLNDCDIYELLTDGYDMVSDCQVVPNGEAHEAFPVWVEYKYGADEMPAQVSRAVLMLAAYMLRPSNRPVGATGESTDAGYIHFTTAGQDGATDIPEVNAAIQQFGRNVVPLW